MKRNTKAYTAAGDEQITAEQGNAIIVQLEGTSTPDGTVDFQTSIDGVNWTNCVYRSKDSVTAARSVAQLSSITTATSYLIYPPVTQFRARILSLTTGTITVTVKEVEYSPPFDGRWADDELLALGSDGDVVAVLRSTALAADTALTDVIEGTPVTPAIAANSLILSNITDDGDILIAISKAGNSVGVFWADGSTGDTAVLAASGQSVDVYIAGTKWYDFAANAATFEGAASTSNMSLVVSNTTNSDASHAIIEAKVGGTTSTGDPQFRWTIPSGTSWYAGPDNSHASDRLNFGTGTTVGSNVFLQIDPRTTTSGNALIQFGVSYPTITLASGAGARISSVSVNTNTVNYTGTTQGTTLSAWAIISAPTLAGDTATLTIDKATNLQVLGAPIEGSNVVITDASAIRVMNSSSGTPVNQHGIYIEDMTAGATADYGITIEGADTAAIWVQSADPIRMGTAGTATGTATWEGATSGVVTVTVAAAAGTWTLTLPTAVGSAGEQLTDAAGDGVTSWAAAASLREHKNIVGEVTAQDALDAILGTRTVSRFKYREGQGTGDYETVYVGPMADEAPWAMHFNESIVNPVNTLGYMILGFQAVADKIESLRSELEAAGVVGG